MAVEFFTPKGSNGILDVPDSAGDGTYPSSDATALTGLDDTAPILRIRATTDVWINFGDESVTAENRVGTFVEANVLTFLGLGSATHFAICFDSPVNGQKLYYTAGL